MDGSNYGILLLNNLKILGANFDSLRLPTDPNQIGNTLRSFPKLVLGKLLGFLLSKLDNNRFERTIRPLLICYNRAVDNQLKNLFFMWIKELPMELGLSIGFSRVWSCPCPRKSSRFFAILTTYVLEKCMIPDSNDAFDGNVDEFLRNISLLKSKYSSIDKLVAAKKSLPTFTDSKFLFDCLNLAKLPISDVGVLYKLSFYQRNRWAELQSLRNLFSLHCTEWFAMRPLYMDMSVLSGVSSIVRSKDLYNSMDMAPDTNELSSLSRLMERTDDLFRTIWNSLARFGDVGRSLETEPSSELSWCLRSLSRFVESSKFFDQQKLAKDSQALLSRLDDVLAVLGDLVAEESEILSVSINQSFGRLSGLYKVNSMDSMGKSSLQSVPQNNSSLIFKSAASYSTPIKGTADLVGGKSDEIGRFTENLTGLLPNATAGVTGFLANDDLFTNVNVQLASLLPVSTSNVHHKSIDNETAGDVQSNLHTETPHIHPPLVPLRLSSRRASLKSLRIGTAVSSEQIVNRRGTVLSNTHSSSYFKSFSEFCIESNDSNSKSPRPPLATIDMNVEDRVRPTFPLYLNSPLEEGENQQGDGAKRENDSGPDDESLGLLSFGDMSDCVS